MTTKDNTGDRLVESIRRTKAGAAGAEAEPAKPKPASGGRPATRKSASTRRTPKPKTGTSGDRFQSVGRVWPD